MCPIVTGADVCVYIFTTNTLRTSDKQETTGKLLQKHHTLGLKKKKKNPVNSFTKAAFTSLCPGTTLKYILYIFYKWPEQFFLLKILWTQKYKSWHFNISERKKLRT